MELDDSRRRVGADSPAWEGGPPLPSASGVASPLPQLIRLTSPWRGVQTPGSSLHHPQSPFLVFLFPQFAGMATRLIKQQSQPIHALFKFLQSKARVEVWLYEQVHTRLEGVILVRRN